MCGPSDDQQQLEDEQTQFYATLQQRDQTEFGEQQAILQQMQSIYAPILQAGPNADGFSPAEENDLKTQSTEQTAANFSQAKKALGEQQSADGGGDTYLPSGVKTEQDEQLDSSAEALRSQEELGIKQAGYAQGYTEFTNATSALDTAAGLEDPNAGAAAATSAGSAADTEANAIAAQGESWMAPVFGAIGAVGGAATGAAIMHH